MNAKTILDDQVIHIKRGRMNGLGFEPAFNSYFDFYLSPKYIDPPLIKLEDGMFHLFLRKNLNDHNKAWKMPSIRQIKHRLSIGQDKIEAMMTRLEQAHLLTKESGYRKGDAGQNTHNGYILSDPIATLEEFLEVAAAGAFPRPLNAAYQGAIATYCDTAQETPVPDLGTPPVPDLGTPPVPDLGTYKQTLKNKQTGRNTVDVRLEELRFTLGEKVFDRWLDGAQVLSTDNDVAVIGIPQPYARDFIENRLSGKIARLLGVASVRCVVMET